MPPRNDAIVIEELESDGNEDISIEAFGEETYHFREEDIDNSIGNLSDINLISNDHYDNFATESHNPDGPNEENDEDANDLSFDSFPSTNIGEFAFEVEEEIPKKGVYVSGHVILNQCGSILTRKTHQIKGSSLQMFFLQYICPTIPGKSIPLLYSEGTMFPDIFYKTEKYGSIIGEIPASMLSDTIYRYLFYSIPQYIRSGFTASVHRTYTDPRYVSYSYDTLTNLTVDHQDHRIIMNRGLTASSNESSGLGGRGKNDSALLESIDSRKITRSLSTAYEYIKNDFLSRIHAIKRNILI